MTHRNEARNIDGKSQRVTLVREMNRDFRREMAHAPANTRWQDLRGRFDTKEFSFVDGVLQTRNSHPRYPRRNEVQVEVSAVNLNAFPLESQGVTSLHEFSGVVTSVGEGVTGITRGDHVVGRDRSQNCFKNVVTTSADNVHLTQEWVKSDISAVAHLSTSVLAYRVLETLRPKDDDRVLVLHGEDVVAQKVSELLSKNNVPYSVVSQSQCAKLCDMGLNGKEEQDITADTLRNITAVVDVARDSISMTHVPSNITYVSATVRPRNLERPDNARVLTINSPSDNTEFFRLYDEATHLLKPHVEAILPIASPQQINELFVLMQKTGNERNCVITLQ